LATQAPAARGYTAAILGQEEAMEHSEVIRVLTQLADSERAWLAFATVADLAEINYLLFTIRECIAEELQGRARLTDERNTPSCQP
jgi:hypothetical protein